MTISFDRATTDLWHSLGLEDPKPLDGMLSLEVSGQVVHIAEQPSGHMLMFGHLASLHPNDMDTVLQENLFGNDPNQPIAARTSVDGNWIFWNRQLLDRCETLAMHQQLESLVDVLEQRTMGLG